MWMMLFGDYSALFCSLYEIDFYSVLKAVR